MGSSVSFRSLDLSQPRQLKMHMQIVLVLASWLAAESAAVKNFTVDEVLECSVKFDDDIKGCGSTDSLLKYTDDDVDMTDYIIPKDFNMNEIIDRITNGNGYYIIRGLYSEKDAEMARERVFFHTKAKEYMKKVEEHHVSLDERHNKFNGLVWALINKGKIFEKMPSQPGQLPHLDYPYYRNFYPSVNPNIMDSAPPLAIQFVTMLTEFNKNNGGTAVRPHSHHNPHYPEDQDEFMKNMIQVEG